MAYSLEGISLQKASKTIREDISVLPMFLCERILRYRKVNDIPSIAFATLDLFCNKRPKTKLELLNNCLLSVEDCNILPGFQIIQNICGSFISV